MADVKALIDELTLIEKAALTSGEDMFSTAAVERLGIPKVHVTDGPSGARGSGLPGASGPPSICIPCGSAIGATWNPDLAGRLGALVGREALDRGCRGLLAPTVNLHRSPLAGRNFECYSEDPLLSGRLAVGYVQGVQSQGVFATVKHFVGNEAEFERGHISSEIDQRALRELYLLPFELAVREGGALAIMTAYNRLNGKWLTQQAEMLLDLLRDEWGFEGLVMTDWFAVADTTSSLGAGLDLEMPGPGRALGAAVAAAITDGSISETELDAALLRLLGGLDRLGILDALEPPQEPKLPSDDDVSLLRHAASESMVLLSNDGILPLQLDSLKQIAVIGPLAMSPSIMGGGSAQVTPHTLTTPIEALAEAVGTKAELKLARGCESSPSGAIVGGSVLRAPDGFRGEKFAGAHFNGPILEEIQLDSLRMVAIGGHGGEPVSGEWSLRVRGLVTPTESGVLQLSMAQVGRARLIVNGEVVLDAFDHPAPPGGTEFFGQASQDITVDLPFESGLPVEVLVEFATVNANFAAFRVAFRTSDAAALIDRAAQTAAEADVAVVFVGTSGEVESEGHDRVSLELPGDQPDLIKAVLAANPRTVVVVNAGAPVDMSWAGDAAAVLQCWFGGQEMAGALADVLCGDAEPGGRLPTTIPMKLEHNPSYANFPGENGTLRYGEGIFMGYRGYEHSAITPRFAFGHGLSYTTFHIGEPKLSAAIFRPGAPITVSVPVTNTGLRAGSEVVQCYVAPQAARLARPPKELKAFTKVRLEAGESTMVDLVLEARAFAYWDPGQDDWDDIETMIPDMFKALSPPAERRAKGWQVDAGRYDVLIGQSSENISVSCSVEIPVETSGRLL